MAVARWRRQLGGGATAAAARWRRSAAVATAAAAKQWRRRTTADKEAEMMRGGGVNAAINRRTRDEGRDKEGEDGKGDGDTMVLAVMDGATVTA